SRFLKPIDHNRRRGLIYRATERMFDLLLDVYDHSLQFVLRHRAATLVVSVAILVATGVLFMRIPKGFIPDSDADQVLVQTEAEQGTSFAQMSKYQQQVADIFRKDPAVLAFSSSISGSNSFVASNGPNFGRMFAHLKPRAERDDLDTVIGRLRRKMA